MREEQLSELGDRKTEINLSSRKRIEFKKKMNRASVIYSKWPNTFAMNSQKKSMCVKGKVQKNI